MKKIYLLPMLAFIAISVASCDMFSLKNNDFIGEYEMTTEVIFSYEILGNQYIDTFLLSEPATIYKEQNKLFIQTNHFGLPGIMGDNPIPLEKDEPKFSPLREDSVDNIVGPESAVILYIKNGLLYSRYSGVDVRSLPIEVKTITSRELIMDDSEEIILPIVDYIGEIYISLHFEYGPIIKHNEVLTWEIDLMSKIVEAEDSGYNIALKYKNVLKKIK